MSEPAKQPSVLELVPPAPPRDEAGIPPTPELQRLIDHIPIARRGMDTKGTHQVRVACRRLLVWLQISGWEVYADDVRWLRRKAAAARDLDVIMEAAPPRRLSEWLQPRHVAARATVHRVLVHPRVQGLLAGIAVLPPTDPRRFRKAVRRLSRQVQRKGRRIERPGATLADFHAARRKLRELRYALEWLGEKPENLIELQDALGAYVDAAVLMGHVQAYPHRGHLRGYRRHVEARMAVTRRRARRAWRRTAPALRRIEKRCSST